MRSGGSGAVRGAAGFGGLLGNLVVALTVERPLATEEALSLLVDSLRWEARPLASPAAVALASRR